MVETMGTHKYTTSSEPSLAISDHLEAIRKECHKVSTAIPNYFQRTVFQSLVDVLVSKISGDLAKALEEDTRVLREKTQLPDSESRRSFSDRNLFAVPQIVFSKRRHRLKYESVLGHIQLDCTSWRSIPLRLEEHDLYKHEYESRWNIDSNLTVHPSIWLQTVGIGYGFQLAFSRSFKGLDFRIRSYHAVADDAPIFHVSKIGDVDAIRQLFQQRCASPWDTNSKGLTPLFVSFDVNLLSAP
jgi:hypothetical protein